MPHLQHPQPPTLLSPMKSNPSRVDYSEGDFMNNEYLNVGDVGTLTGDLTNAASALCNMTQE